jgi:hypothetical protein
MAFPVGLRIHYPGDLQKVFSVGSTYLVKPPNQLQDTGACLLRFVEADGPAVRLQDFALRILPTRCNPVLGA